MTDEPRSANDIERDIERERSELERTVGALQDRFSPDRIMREIGRGLSEHGGDMGHAISRSVKQNPVALALTGIGLAWLMTGRSHDDRPDTDAAAFRRRPAAPRPVAAGRPDRGTGPRPEHPSARAVTQGHSVWYYADEDDLWDDTEDDGSAGFRDRMRDAASGMRDRARSSAGGARGGVASARDSVSARAGRIRHRLSHGTETLSEEARDRIVRARWAAVRARRSAERQARAGVDRASDFYEANPLVGGALAIAAGALLAGSLPRTRQEDAYFGDMSDHAFDEAERLFQSERDKAMAVADRAADSAREVLDEKRGSIDEQAPGKKSAAEHAADEVRDGVSRVAGSARDEAGKQGLGKPSS